MIFGFSGSGLGDSAMGSGGFSAPPVPVKDSLRGVPPGCRRGGFPSSIALSPSVFLLAQVITSRGRNDPREFLPRSDDFSVRVQRAVNVDLQGAQRAFDQILHAVLRIGRRGGLVNAQRFPEQINRLIAHAVERLDKLISTLLIAAHGLSTDLINGFLRCRGRLSGICSTHILSLLLFFVFVVRAPGDA